MNWMSVVPRNTLTLALSHDGRGDTRHVYSPVIYKWVRHKLIDEDFQTHIWVVDDGRENTFEVGVSHP